KSSDERWLLREFLRQLGPAGKVIGAIATAVSKTSPRRTTGDRDVDSAREFLEALGHRTLTPASAGAGNHAKDAQNAAELLRQHGYEVDLAGKRIKEPSGREQSKQREEAAPVSPGASKPQTSERPTASAPNGEIEVETGTG